MTLSNELRKLIDNPDDLSALPQLIARVQQLETAEIDNQTRITKLQESNRAYLAQIPIPNNDPTDKKEEEKEPVTLADAHTYMQDYLKGENN